jgi:putative selenate reductase
VTLFIDMPDAGETPEGFTQTTQILHIDDFCNECGNCETFCIHEGKPYTVKPTLFSGEQTFSASDNSGFYLKHDGKQGYGFVCRLDGHVYDMFIDGETVRFSRDRDVPGMIGLQRVAQELLSKHRYLLF